MPDRSVASTNQWKEGRAGGGSAFPGVIVASPDFAGFETVGDEGEPTAFLVQHPDFPEFLTIEEPDFPADAVLADSPDFAGFVSPVDAGTETAVLVADPAFSGFVTPSDDLAAPVYATLETDPAAAGFVTPSRDPTGADEAGHFMIVGGTWAVPMTN